MEICHQYLVEMPHFGEEGVVVVPGCCVLLRVVVGWHSSFSWHLEFLAVVAESAHSEQFLLVPAVGQTRIGACCAFV